MLLNNFTATLYPAMSVTVTDGTIIKNASNSSSEPLTVPASEYKENSATGYFNMHRRGIAFGSGTTPPQKTDYKLNNYITTGLTYSGNNTNQTNKVVNWVQTIQNTSTEQITITEVGLFTIYSTNCVVTLLTRTVLDNPVVLQPNEVKTFTITIDYNKFVDGTIVQNA